MDIVVLWIDEEGRVGRMINCGQSMDVAIVKGMLLAYEQGHDLDSTQKKMLEKWGYVRFGVNSKGNAGSLQLGGLE